jgi:RNA polymerase primary sigma factor
MAIAPEKIHQIRAAARPLVSIDGNAYDDDRSLADSLADADMANPEERFIDGELHMEMGAALRLLNPRERDIVVRYYGLGEHEPASLETIGQQFHLSRERVRQIRNQALARIRTTTTGARLSAYLS